MLAVSVNLTMYNVNQTTFHDVKPVLESIVSDYTSSPSEAVFAVFMEMISTTLRNTDELAVVNVTVMPMDSTHEIEILAQMGNATLFRSEINSVLETMTHLYSAAVEEVSDYTRTPGKLV